MRILFMGTPDIAAECLKALYAAGHEICGVYTRRDKPVGRKQVLTAPPVKEVALEHGTPVFQPRTPTQNQPTMARPPTRGLKALVLQKLLPHIFGARRHKPQLAVLNLCKRERTHMRLPAHTRRQIPRRHRRQILQHRIQSVHVSSCHLTSLFGMGSQFGKLELEELFAAVDIAESRGDVADREERKAAVVGAIVLLANAHHVPKARLTHLVAHDCIILERGLAG